jgi:DNA polymerase III sliding clamp (beta) subunit (PCNA family)
MAKVTAEPVIEPKEQILGEENQEAKTKEEAQFTIEVDKLATVIKVVEKLVNDTKFTIDENGLSCAAMDQANVAMVVFKMPAEEFIELSGKAEVGVSVDNIKKILDRAAKEDKISFKIKDNGIYVKFNSKIDKEFQIPQITLEEVAACKEPELNFKTSIKMESNLLLEAIEDSAWVGESTQFEIAAGRFTVNTKGDLSKYSGIVCSGIDKEAKVKCKFALEYLKKIVPKNVKELTVSIAEDYPLKLNYTLNKTSMVLILAPRISDD